MFWRRKVQKFSWPEVDFSLDVEDVIGREGGEIGVLWDKLTDELVCVFDEAFLPGGVWVCEIDLGVELFGDIFVVGELGSVVGGDGEDMVFERAQHLYDKPCHSLGILAFWGFGHKHLLGGAFDNGDDGTLAALPDYGVHRPVTEACLGVHHGRALIDAQAVLDGDA